MGRGPHLLNALTAMDARDRNGRFGILVTPEGQVAESCVLNVALVDAAGVFRTPPPFDHSKLFVVDGAWSLIGSTNWDARSLRLNFEYNLECYDRGLAARLDAIIDAKIAAARPEDRARIEGRPLPLRLRDGLTRLLSPYL